MGVRARLTLTVRTDCWKVSTILARSMSLLVHCSRASNQVMFLTSRRKVWLPMLKASSEMLGSSILSVIRH